VSQVFLSYARADGESAKRLYDDLRRLVSTRVWYDRVDLLPGLKWKPAIFKAIRESDYFIAVLSQNSVSTRGVRHSELRKALEVADEFPEDWIFLVPTRLDDCPMPISELEEFTYADLFPNWKEGIAQLSRIFRRQADGKLPSAGKHTSGNTAAAMVGSNIGKPVEIHGRRLHQEHHRHARPSKAVRAGFHYKVGLADLDQTASSSIIGRVARGLNGVQSIFHLAPERLATPRKALKKFDGTLQLYIPRLPSTFYERIGPLEMDCVICLTRRLLVFEEDDEIQFNYLAGPSPSDDRVFFVSHANLAEYAQAARVTLEVAIAHLITAELASYFLDLDYHDKTRNCPMDFKEHHSDLVGALRVGKFCTFCSRKLNTGISRPFAEAFRAMIAWGR